MKCYIKKNEIIYERSDITEESYLVRILTEIQEELYKNNITFRRETECLRGYIYETPDETKERKNEIIDNIIISEVRNKFKYYEELENNIAEKTDNLKIDVVRARRLIP